MSELRDAPLVECMEWISQELKIEGECSFAYGIENNWEYLIFNTKCYFIDAKRIMRILKCTGMNMIQVTSSNGVGELCFGRPLEKYKLKVSIIRS